jgi:hypothetical protein
MDARQRLMDIVGRMTEEDARLLLDEGRGLIRGRRIGPVSEPPTFTELARMSLEEREPYLRSMHFEVDMEELKAWEDLTIGDGLDDDDPIVRRV